MATDLTKLTTLVRSVNLEAVLETAELVVAIAPIPFLPIIIKILKYLVKFSSKINAVSGS